LTDSLIGEYSVIRAGWGEHRGSYTSPLTQIIAVNHAFDDPDKPFVDQGSPPRITLKMMSDRFRSDHTDGVCWKGAVVAGGSVVDDVPAHTVVSVPARILRDITGEEIKKNSPIYYSPQDVLAR
jgi:hypothetical protein